MLTDNYIENIEFHPSTFDVNPANLEKYLDFCMEKFRHRYISPLTFSEMRNELQKAILYFYSLGYTLNDDRGNRIYDPKEIDFDVGLKEDGKSVYVDLLHKQLYIRYGDNK